MKEAAAQAGYTGIFPRKNEELRELLIQLTTPTHPVSTVIVPEAVSQHPDAETRHHPDTAATNPEATVNPSIIGLGTAVFPEALRYSDTVTHPDNTILLSLSKSIEELSKKIDIIHQILITKAGAALTPPPTTSSAGNQDQNLVDQQDSDPSVGEIDIEVLKTCLEIHAKGAMVCCPNSSALTSFRKVLLALVAAKYFVLSRKGNSANLPVLVTVLKNDQQSILKHFKDVLDQSKLVTTDRINKDFELIESSRQDIHRSQMLTMILKNNLDNREDYKFIAEHFNSN